MTLSPNAPNPKSGFRGEGQLIMARHDQKTFLYFLTFNQQATNNKTGQWTLNKMAVKEML